MKEERRLKAIGQESKGKVDVRHLDKAIEKQVEQVALTLSWSKYSVTVGGVVISSHFTLVTLTISPCLLPLAVHIINSFSFTVSICRRATLLD